MFWRQVIHLLSKSLLCGSRSNKHQSKGIHCRSDLPNIHIGYSFRLAARVLLYAPSHRQDSTYHSLCYTSRGALAGTRNSSMGPPHEGSIRRPIAPWANTFTMELHLALHSQESKVKFVLFNDATGTHWFLSLSSVIGRHSYGHVDTLFRRKPAAAT